MGGGGVYIKTHGLRGDVLFNIALFLLTGNILPFFGEFVKKKNTHCSTVKSLDIEYFSKGAKTRK